jgi:hypothetical protein
MEIYPQEIQHLLWNSEIMTLLKTTKSIQELTKYVIIIKMIV